MSLLNPILECILASAMGCAEDLRLSQAYEAALRAWNLNHSSFLNGEVSIDASSRLRRELLRARLKAANDLYDHSVKCRDCKMTKIHLFEDERLGHLTARSVTDSEEQD
jgi:hypothetical protein